MPDRYLQKGAAVVVNNKTLDYSVHQGAVAEVLLSYHSYAISIVLISSLLSIFRHSALPSTVLVVSRPHLEELRWRQPDDDGLYPIQEQHQDTPPTVVRASIHR